MGMTNFPESKYSLSQCLNVLTSQISLLKADKTGLQMIQIPFHTLNNLSVLLHVSYKYLLCTVCSRFSSNSWARGTLSTNRVWACHFHWPTTARKFLRPTRDTCVSFVGFWWSLASVIVSETTNLVSYNTHIRKYRYTSWCFEVIIRLHPWNQWIELQRNTNKEGYLLKVNHRFL